jgi:TolB protein
LSDADTFNEQEVMRHHMPLFSPTWSPDNSKLAFAMAGSLGQAIFIFDVATGRAPVRITKRSMKASAPSWSPDGKKLAMQVLENVSADIYILDLETKKTERITRHWSIDAEPAWSPDNKSIVFTSELGGSPQLYQYLFETKKIQRLTFKGKQNLRASFSPDGKMITFVHLTVNNGYNIAVMDLNSKEMRIAADSGKGESEHESPSFAPNGSMIIYAANYPQKGKRGRKTGLVAVSVDGNMRQHFIDKGEGEVREPAWSSYLN